MTDLRAMSVSAGMESPRAGALGEIPRIGVPSRAAFSDYVRRGRPVVIAGALEDCPARRWSPEHFKSAYGDRMIPVAPVRDGKVVYGAEFGVRYEQIRFGGGSTGCLRVRRRPTTRCSTSLKCSRIWRTISASHRSARRRPGRRRGSG